MKRVKQTAVGVGILVLVGLILYCPPSFLRVQEVVVLTPMKHLSEFDLIRLTGVQKGDKMLSLRLSKIRENMKRYPWIKEVRLSKRFPGRLMIWVEEQEPVALLEMDSSLYFINRDGALFKKADAGESKDLPILTGVGSEDVHDVLKPLLSILEFFDGFEELSAIGVSELHWDRVVGVSLFTKEPCIRIEMGDADWKGKLERLATAWPSIRSTSKRPKVVDLSFEKRIVVRQEL